MLLLIQAVSIFVLLFAQVSSQDVGANNHSSELESLPSIPKQMYTRAKTHIFVYGEGLQSLPTLSKHLLHPEQDLVYSYSVGDNVTLAYALCDRHDDKHKKCVLTLETLDSDEKNGTRTCEFNLSTTKDNETISRNINLAQFGHNNIVLAWKEGQIYTKLNETPIFKEYLKVGVVEMESCKIHEMNITTADNWDKNLDNENKIINLNIVGYNDGVEFIYRNILLCTSVESCIITYDSKTHKFSNESPVRCLPLESFPNGRILADSSLGSMSTTDKIYSSSSPYSSVIDIVNMALGHRTGRYVMSESENRTMIPSNLTVSIAHRAFGFCSWVPVRPQMECSVFDGQGEHRIFVPLDLYSQGARWIKMRNLEGGGFLLMTGYEAGNKTDRFGSLEYMRFRPKEELVLAYRLPFFRCPEKGTIADMDFFQRPGFRYCFYVACARPGLEIEESPGDSDEFRMSLHRYCLP